jgi:membrane protein
VKEYALEFLRPLLQRLRHFLTEPVEEFGRTRRALQYSGRLAFHCYRKLKQDRASQMAAALTYRTLFSLLPMLALALVVLGSFQGLEQYHERFRENIVEFLLPDTLLAVKIEETSAGRGELRDEVRDEPHEVEPRALDNARYQLGERIGSIIDQLSQINFQGIGIVGVLIFVYAATMLLSTIERSFNSVFGVEHARPWYLSLTFYYAVVTLGPIVLIAGQVLQQTAYETLKAGAWTNWLAGPLVVASPVLTTWIVLCLMFVLLPHTLVHKQPALIGSLVAAVLWVITQELFAVYVSRAAVTSLYGALGVVPLFLYWIFLTWLIVLFGLELTATLQGMRTGRLRRADLRDAPELGETGDHVDNPQWLLPVMIRLGGLFTQGRHADAPDLADQLGLPAPAVGRLLGRLEAAGLVHRVRRGDAEGFALAMPAGRITLRQLVDLAGELGRTRTARRTSREWSYLDKLGSAMKDAAGDATLEDLLTQGGGPSDPGPTR